ncbi:MAG: hypothetical protein QME71_03155, partial [Dehalococcoidia bacterium]|nr:hypothetical protein [Dehalococcoidia bacterium]
SVEELVPASSEAVVLAIQRSTGDLVLGPSSSATVQKDDILIVVGYEADLEPLFRLGHPGPHAP